MRKEPMVVRSSKVKREREQLIGTLSKYACSVVASSSRIGREKEREKDIIVAVVEHVDEGKKSSLWK